MIVRCAPRTPRAGVAAPPPAGFVLLPAAERDRLLLLVGAELDDLLGRAATLLRGQRRLRLGVRLRATQRSLARLGVARGRDGEPSLRLRPGLAHSDAVGFFGPGPARPGTAPASASPDATDQGFFLFLSSGVGETSSLWTREDDTRRKRGKRRMNTNEGVRFRSVSFARARARARARSYTTRFRFPAARVFRSFGALENRDLKRHERRSI